MKQTTNFCILPLLFSLLLSYCSFGTKLLLIGDSLDRHMSQEWCREQRNRGRWGQEFNWGEGSIKHSNGMRIPSWICISDNEDSIAFVHIYGSNATGPYFHNYMSGPGDLLVDTRPRINKSISLYTKQFGLPKRIILHTAQWDLQYWYDFFEVPSENSELWNKSVAVFERNINERLDDIELLVGLDATSTEPRAIDIGLRTAVWEKKGGLLLSRFNEIIRKTAFNRNLTLFDYDKEIWGTVGFNYSEEVNLFRDWIHPKPFYSVRAAEKLLGRRYTANMIFRINASEELQKFQSFLTAPPNGAITVSLVREIGSNKTLYYDRESKSWWRNLTPEFLALARLGSQETLIVNSSVISLLPFGPIIPSIYKEGSVVNSTSTGTVYLVTGWTRRKIPPSLQLSVALQYQTNITLVDNQAFVDIIAEGFPIPEVVEGDVIQRRGAREIFYFKNGTKHSIPNMDTFFALGKDLKDVKLLSFEEIEMLPPGAPL